MIVLETILAHIVWWLLVIFNFFNCTCRNYISNKVENDVEKAPIYQQYKSQDMWQHSTVEMPDGTIWKY